MTTQDMVEEVIGQNYNIDSGVFIIPISEIAAQIMSLPAEGWVVKDVCDGGTYMTGDRHSEDYVTHEFCSKCHGSCRITRPATFQEVFAKKAVEA